MSSAKNKTIPIRLKFDCSKCPGYCCAYELIPVRKRDVERLARHFDLSYEAAEQRFTKTVDGQRAMRHRDDHIYKSTCMHLDQEERRCTIYEARPWICREFPSGPKCGYYEFLKFERSQQDDEAFVPGNC